MSGGEPETPATRDQQDALMLLAAYLSAIIHDYDHRGLTNPFLIEDEDPLAVRGTRDRSPFHLHFCQIVVKHH